MKSDTSLYINEKKTTPKCNIVKPMKEKILRAASEKQHATYRGTMLQMTNNFTSEAREAGYYKMTSLKC